MVRLHVYSLFFFTEILDIENPIIQAGWVLGNGSRRAHSPYQKLIESQRNEKTSCISLEVSVSIRSSDLVSIIILLPATLTRFPHTFCKLHRLSSTCVRLSPNLCAPCSLNTINCNGFPFVHPRDSFNQCTGITGLGITGSFFRIQPLTFQSGRMICLPTVRIHSKWMSWIRLPLLYWHVPQIACPVV